MYPLCYICAVQSSRIFGPRDEVLNRLIYRVFLLFSDRAHSKRWKDFSTSWMSVGTSCVVQIGESSLPPKTPSKTRHGERDAHPPVTSDACAGKKRSCTRRNTPTVFRRVCSDRTVSLPRCV